MKEETKVTATPTIAEKLGIKYKEVDGLFIRCGVSQMLKTLLR